VGFVWPIQVSFLFFSCSFFFSHLPLPHART
jgi:hypothetical protein